MSAKHDRTMDAIFSQLEFLGELAGSVDETELATSLRSLLDAELMKYCENKRAALGSLMAAETPPLKKVA